MWTQCVQRNPTITVPKKPKSNPPFLKAFGIAKMPVPKELFSKWIRDPNDLKLNKIGLWIGEILIHAKLCNEGNNLIKFFFRIAV